MIRLRPSTLAMVAGLCVGGCATSGGGGGGSAGSPMGAITRAELDESSASDAYEAVQLHRSRWLRSRASPTPQDPNPQPVVYVDGARRGGLAELRTISIHDIEMIQFVNARDATTRWGTGHRAGVIEIMTRR